jgi:succinate dehydrogenase / fumarate reductase iron-sulfur subunit
MYRFEILRYDPAKEEEPRFQIYDLEGDANMSVLEGILKIQDQQDPSLAFRYACRGAVCGSCAMSINGRLDLACRVLLGNLSSATVVIEPLPNYEIIRDLVVEMGPFWEKYERVRPWLQSAVSDTSGEKESLMSEEQRDKIDQYVNCILCGLCYAACPVLRSNGQFTGPAALAKLYRFIADSRDDRDDGTLEQEDAHEGVWGCHTIMRCIEACPKQVRPTDGIEGLRRKLVTKKLQSLTRSKK